MSDSKILRGCASQFFVAGELCRRGVVAAITLGNCPNTDILCSNRDGTRFAHIQVKTFVPRAGGGTCSVGEKAEKNEYGATFFWVLAGIPAPTPGDESNDPKDRFEYFIIPSDEMKKNIAESFGLWRQAPGKHGQPHAEDNAIRTVRLPPGTCRNGWDIQQYLGNWKPILDLLGIDS